MRTLAQDGPLPTVLRLSDEAETAVGGGDGCLMIVGVEGGAEVEARYAGVSGRLAGLGGKDLGAAPGDAWVRGRYASPYLRDALMDTGALAETLETATFWSNLPAVYAAVREAPAHELPGSLVLCHISHVYPTGASHYLAVLAAPGRRSGGAVAAGEGGGQ
jgi:alkyldihydroxyacetonephosphate synthase